MPLMQGKSQASFGHNVAAEMNAGKPRAQSLAIAYAVKRKAAKKMASGGEVMNEKLHPDFEPRRGSMVKRIMEKMMAKGGMVDDEKMPMSDEDFLSDEADTPSVELTYPDPDMMEETEGMGEKEKKAAMIRGIMMKMR